MDSSVEIWDTATLCHIGSHSFGRTNGSLTWIVRRDGKWLACFCHYGHKAGEPGRGSEWTHLVEYDDEWRAIGGWGFPRELMAHAGKRGYGISGGVMGADGTLYVTGHDDQEMYALRFPDAGSTLIWRETIAIPVGGQAFDCDPNDASVFYFISKKERAVIAARFATR